VAPPTSNDRSILTFELGLAFWASPNQVALMEHFNGCLPVHLFNFSLTAVWGAAKSPDALFKSKRL
jgi:hypothetical protein